MMASLPVWLTYATKGHDYEPVAAVTTEEARQAVNRLLGCGIPECWGQHAGLVLPCLRWWQFYGPVGDYN